MMCINELFVNQVDLSFSLGEEKTIVSAKISVVPRVNGMICCFGHFSNILLIKTTDSFIFATLHNKKHTIFCILFY